MNKTGVEDPDDRNTRAISIRFWSLTITTYFFAIAFCISAVWLTTQPYLKSIQQDTLNSIAENKATLLNARLQEYVQFLEYFAASREVVSFAIGDVIDKEPTMRLLESIKPPPGLEQIEIRDILNEPVFGREFGGVIAETGPLSEFYRLSDQLFADPQTLAERVTVMPTAHIWTFSIVVPIKRRDYVEGALAARFAVNIDALFPDESMSKIVEISPVTEGGIAFKDAEAGINYGNLKIKLVPDNAAVARLGLDLVENVSVAVAAVLILPFLIFSIVGRTALIKPHIDLKLSQRALKAQTQQLEELAAVAEKASEAIIVTDTDHHILWVNPAFEKISGYRTDEVVGKKPGPILQGKETSSDSRADIRNALSQALPVETELLNYHKSGTSYWIRLSITPLRRSDGFVYGYMAISRDITLEHKQKRALQEANERIEYQSLHDPLTGLPNRRYLDRAIAQRCSSATDHVTLVRIDLDHFKYVNDTLGHAAGDHVLVEVARILREETRNSDLPVRVGGDEFVVLLAPGAPLAQGVDLADRLLARIRKPTVFEKKIVQVGASFGVASTQDALLGVEELQIGADSALYAAKDAGRNRVKLYTPELHKHAVEMRSLATEIRQAIDQEQFVPFYQPQFNAKTGELSGLETLMRWQSPRRGLCAPDVFMDVAEQLSVLNDIDKIVLRKALDGVCALNAEGQIIPKISFNVTASRLCDPGLSAFVKEHTPKGVKVGFEILESVLLEDNSASFKFDVDRLKEQNLEIEIDDFGSGHASIVGLMEAGPDTLKIDQRLIFPITDSEAHRKMVKAIVDIARALDISIIAEGVETKEHAQLLTELGCHHLQGYYFARPMDQAALSVYLDKLKPGGLKRRS